jgi:hypothetical protein
MSLRYANRKDYEINHTLHFAAGIFDFYYE